jgi:DUF1009 family protein
MSKLGIIAGGGNLPKKIIQACRQIGRDHYIIGFEGMTSQDVLDGSPHSWASLGQINATLEKLKQENVTDVVFVGRIERPSFSALKMDKRAAGLLAKAALRGFGDNAVLSLIMEEIEKDGFKVIAAQELLDDLLAPMGVLGTHLPDDQAMLDIQKGKDILTQMSPMDIGQSVVVQEGMVLGIEAIEGTDALIERCASVKRDGIPGVLVKMRKIGQDNRVDLPTIGPETIKKAKEAGLRGIAVEAKGTIILNREEVIDFANKSNMFLIGVAAAS